jgi:hypothetical protein
VLGYLAFIRSEVGGRSSRRCGGVPEMTHSRGNDHAVVISNEFMVTNQARTIGVKLPRYDLKFICFFTKWIDMPKIDMYAPSIMSCITGYRLERRFTAKIHSYRTLLALFAGPSMSFIPF